LKKPILNCLARTVLFVLVITAGAVGQPKVVSEGIEFTYCGSANSVDIVGEFNQWRRGSDSLQKLRDNCWSIVKKLSPGLCQYKYVVEIDSTCWVLDSSNPVRVENYNGSSMNSVFIVKEDGSILLRNIQNGNLL
jgi:1,4-alpha-glucan branching enzyme